MILYMCLVFNHYNGVFAIDGGSTDKVRKVKFRIFQRLGNLPEVRKIIMAELLSRSVWTQSFHVKQYLPVLQ